MHMKGRYLQDLTDLFSWTFLNISDTEKQRQTKRCVQPKRAQTDVELSALALQDTDLLSKTSPLLLWRLDICSLGVGIAFIARLRGRTLHSPLSHIHCDLRGRQRQEDERGTRWETGRRGEGRQEGRDRGRRSAEQSAKGQKAKLCRPVRSRRERWRVKKTQEAIKRDGRGGEDAEQRWGEKGRQEERKRRRNMNNVTCAHFPSKYQAAFNVKVEKQMSMKSPKRRRSSLNKLDFYK